MVLFVCVTDIDDQKYSSCLYCVFVCVLVIYRRPEIFGLLLCVLVCNKLYMTRNSRVEQPEIFGLCVVCVCVCYRRPEHCRNIRVVIVCVIRKIWVEKQKYSACLLCVLV